MLRLRSLGNGLHFSNSKINGMSYSEAIHYLANRYGVAIDTLPEDQEKKSKHDKECA